jgi:biotin transport system substrate-specific component
VSSTTIASPRVLGDLVPGGLVRDVSLVVGGAALVGLAAQVALPLPFTPVPLSGQTFAVLLVGATLGTLRGLMSMLLYLLVGLAGVPWFAGGESGAAMPSFGYIVGFLAAAALVGHLAERGATRTPLRTAGVMVLGNVMIYAIGVSWLALALGISLTAAIPLGLTPFLLGDAIKIALAAGLLPLTWRLVGRHG